MMLISEQTKNLLDRLIQRGFIHNRTWDNFLGFSNVTWCFSSVSKHFHKNLAHLFPLFSDLVADIELRYNVVPLYYETPTDIRKYNDMLQFCEVNLAEHTETYNLIKEILDSAVEYSDTNVEADVKHLLRIWNRFMEQAILLRDKAQVYAGNNWAFDAFSEQFYVLQDVYDNLTGSNGGDDD